MVKNQFGGLEINNFIAFILLLVLIFLGYFYYKNTVFKENFAVRCGPGTFENNLGICQANSERKPFNGYCPTGYHLCPRGRWCLPN